MWNPFEKKQTGTTVVFTVSGMHCVSCSMNIDGELEDTPGVLSATTRYAEGKTTITYNPDTVSISTLQGVIEKLGYSASAT